MIAKCLPYPARPCPADSAFAKRLDYILAPATQSLALNLLGDPLQDRDLILRQFSLAAATNLRVRHPVCEIVVTFSETQAIEEDELLSAGQRLLTLINAADLQAVLAVHRNTASPHVHILFNRVHPKCGRAYDRHYIKTALEWACRQIEFEQGWPQDRGQFDTEVIEGTVRLLPKPHGYWQAKTAARAAGLRRDSQSQKLRNGTWAKSPLRDLLPRKTLHWLAQNLDAAGSWADVFQVCARAGLRYLRVRGGAHIQRMSDKAWMLASQLGTRFGFQQMCRRLGAFPEPTPAAKAVGAPQTRQSPHVPLSPNLIDRLRDAISALPLRYLVKLADDSRRRRYQAAFRKPVASDHRNTFRITDVTAARQIWMIRDILTHHQADPNPFTQISKAFSDDLCSVSSDRLLVPLRNTTKGITGFLYVSRNRSVPATADWHVSEVAGGTHGFATIGPATAQNIWLLPDPVCLPEVLEDLIHMPEPIRIITAARTIPMTRWTKVLRHLGDQACAVITPSAPPADWQANALRIRPHLPFLALSDLQAVPRMDAAFTEDMVEKDQSDDSPPNALEEADVHDVTDDWF